MHDDEGDKPHLRAVPDWNAIFAEIGKREYLLVKELRDGDTLTIVTAHHRYSFLVLDARRSRVRMTSDNPEFPGPTEGSLLGSLLSPTGSSLMSGRVVVGHCLEMHLPPPELGTMPRRIIFSETQEVLINGFHVLPARSDGVLQ